MRSNIRLTRLTTGIFSKPVTKELTDRRGAKRIIKFWSGVNKGKVYPYASKRQLNRNYGARRGLVQ